MNIDEAQKVLWLKSNPRPLGELLNEGYLNKERLEWAAQWAYNPNLKQAASVILELITNSKTNEKPKVVEVQPSVNLLEIGMTIDKAHSTLWPFAPYKGQMMGGLVDLKQLSLKDLGYAIETAWDEKVRQAAIALSLIRLEQIVKEPAPDAGFVHVVSGGRSYSEREEVRLTFIQGILSGFLLVLMIVLSIWLIISVTMTKPSGKSFSDIVTTPYDFFVLAVVMGAFTFLVWLAISIPDWFSRRLDKKIEEHRFGQEGEEQVLQLIVQVIGRELVMYFKIYVFPGEIKVTWIFY